MKRIPINISVERLAGEFLKAYIEESDEYFEINDVLNAAHFDSLDYVTTVMDVEKQLQCLIDDRVYFFDTTGRTAKDVAQFILDNGYCTVVAPLTNKLCI